MRSTWRWSARARAWGFDVDAVTLGIEEVAQQQFGFVAVLRANQFAEPQPAPAGDAAVESALEGRIHVDNHALRVAAGYGDGSVFEGGAESRAGARSRWGI